MYDPKTAADILKLPPSTLRRFAARFAQHLSAQARAAGRKRKYTPEDLRVLAQARELVAQRKSAGEIDAALGLVAEAPPPEPAQDLRLAPYIAEQFDQMRAGLHDQNSRIADLTQEIRRLRETLEAKSQDQAQRPPWWKRFFGKG